MTLAASGPLSMGGSTANRSVNLELSQAATAQISLNDANVRALAGVPSGAIVLATDFYGKPVVVTETQTVTVGTFSFKGLVQYGFNQGVCGSITDGTFGFISNAPIEVLVWSNTNTLIFQITGIYANSGWTKVTIAGVDFLRTAASYSTNTGPDFTNWTWSGASNVFGTTVGASVPAVFTQ